MKYTDLRLILLMLCCGNVAFVQAQIDPNSVGKPSQFRVSSIPSDAPFRLNVFPAGPAKIVPVPHDLTVIIPGENNVPKANIYKVHYNDIAKFLPQSNLILPPTIHRNAIADIQNIDASQGMLSGSVQCFLEDSNGNIWIGYVAGFSRYTGSSIAHYATPEILSWGNIESILEDKKGNIWFGTESGGIIYFDGNSFAKLGIDEFEINNVTSIVEDKEGRIWFGTSQGVLVLDENQTMKHYNIEHGLSFNTVTSILEDTEGNMWIGTFAGGLNKYDGKRFTQFTTEDGLSTDRIQCIIQDNKGIIWIGYWGGEMNQYDGTNFISYPDGENFYLRSIIQDAAGHIWIARPGELIRFDGNEFTHYSLRGNTRDLIQDSRGNLWIGGSFRISRYQKNSFLHIGMEEEFSNSNIRSILEDHEGNILFGTRSGAYKLDENELTRFYYKDGFEGEVFSMHEDFPGSLWLGTRDGIVHYDGQLFTEYDINKETGLWVINWITNDKKGNTWFATTNGVYRYDGQSFKHFSGDEAMSFDDANCILVDRLDRIWVGSYSGGINIYDGEGFEYYSTKNGLTSNNITSLLEDKNGYVWIGTKGAGINIYNGKEFTSFTTDDGLSNNNIRHILEDDTGNIWVTTEFGVTLISGSAESASDNLNEEKKSWSTFTFKQAEGLKQTNFVRQSGLYDSQNRVWFGTSNGAAMLDLDEYELPTNPPEKVQLAQLDINQKIIDYRNLDESNSEDLDFSQALIGSFDSVVSFQNYPTNLSLPYDLNSLTFHFSAIDWTAPHKIQYSYMIDGVDRDWSPRQHDTKAEYRNLSHGNYTLKVKAIGAAQIWSNPFQYDFRINPPWWQSNVAYGIYGLLFLGGIYLLQRSQRSRTEKLERQKAQVKELEQAKEIEKAYNELGATHENLKATQAQLIQSEKMASLGELTAGIAHEIQNPLNFVNNFSELSNELLDEMKEEIEKGDLEEAKAIAIDIKQNLEKINHHGNRADAIVKGMLQHSRKSTATKEPADINKLTDEYLRLAYHGLKAKDKSFNAKLITDYDDSVGSITVISQDIGRVILNLINNAFYAVSEKKKNAFDDYQPTVSVSTINEGEQISISVKDNGNGIPSENLDKIFQPFFTTKPTGQGTGLGLSLAFDIVTKGHGGELKVETKEGKGTIFVIKLPNTLPKN